MESSIHGNPATHKYKLLQLRQHFSRVAKKIVEPLGYSAAGYEADSTETQIWRRGQKNSLTSRRTGKHQNRPSWKRGRHRKIAYFLDVIVVNLKETGRYEELGKGTLYINLCKR